MQSLCDCHVTHALKCNEMSQPKYGQMINCGLTILIVSLFSLCRLRIKHSLDLALLPKCPVFLQNAPGNPADQDQQNIDVAPTGKILWAPMLAMTVYLPESRSHDTRVRFTVLVSCSNACSSLNPLLFLQRQVADVGSGLFYCWSFLRNNIATNV